MSLAEWIATLLLSFWVTCALLVGLSLIAPARIRRDICGMEEQLQDAQVFTSDKYAQAERELIVFTEGLAKELAER